MNHDLAAAKIDDVWVAMTSGPPDAEWPSATLRAGDSPGEYPYVSIVPWYPNGDDTEVNIMVDQECHLHMMHVNSSTGEPVNHPAAIKKFDATESIHDILAEVTFYIEMFGR